MWWIMSAANCETLIFSVPIWIPFIPLSIFLLCWLWLGLPKLWWIVVMRMYTLVFLLILEEKLSIFLQWGKCLLWVCCIWLLLCWNMFLLSLLSGGFLFHRWMLDFVKVLPASIEITIWFLIFQFVNMVYHTDRFVMLKNPCIPLGHGVWSFKYVVGFCLLEFC